MRVSKAKKFKILCMLLYCIYILLGPKELKFLGEPSRNEYVVERYFMTAVDENGKKYVKVSKSLKTCIELIYHVSITAFVIPKS